MEWDRRQCDVIDYCINNNNINNDDKSKKKKKKNINLNINFAFIQTVFNCHLREYLYLHSTINGLAEKTECQRSDGTRHHFTTRHKKSTQIKQINKSVNTIYKYWIQLKKEMPTESSIIRNICITIIVYMMCAISII